MSMWSARNVLRHRLGIVLAGLAMGGCGLIGFAYYGHVSLAYWGMLLLAAVGGVALLLAASVRPTGASASDEVDDLQRIRRRKGRTGMACVLLGVLAIFGWTVGILPLQIQWPARFQTLHLYTTSLSSLGALVLGLRYVEQRRDLDRWMRESRSMCRSCGYPLKGLPSPRCPECGTPFEPDTTRVPR